MRGRSTPQDVRSGWLEDVLHDKQIHDACRVLLLHLATGLHRKPHRRPGEPLMTPTGYVRDVSHQELADHLGISAKQVGRRLQEAREKKLLAIVGGGYNGQPTMYAAKRRGVKPPAEGGPSAGPASLRDFVKPPAPRGPSQVAERGPSAGNGSSREVTKPPAERGPYVRARARATRESREQEPAPTDGRGPEPHRFRNYRSSRRRAPRLVLVAACASAPTHTTGDDRTCA